MEHRRLVKWLYIYTFWQTPRFDRKRPHLMYLHYGCQWLNLGWRLLYARHLHLFRQEINARDTKARVADMCSTKLFDITSCTPAEDIKLVRGKNKGKNGKASREALVLSTHFDGNWVSRESMVVFCKVSRRRSYLPFHHQSKSLSSYLVAEPSLILSFSQGTILAYAGAAKIGSQGCLSQQWRLGCDDRYRPVRANQKIYGAKRRETWHHAQWTTGFAARHNPSKARQEPAWCWVKGARGI